MNIFQTLFYQPLLNALILLYQFVPGGLGMAIILLTIVIKALLFPLNQKVLKSQKAAAELDPKLKEIREKFKGNQEKIAKETMALYGEAKINPLSGLFLLLIQFPILIALYQVFSKLTVNEELFGLYSFVANPGQIDSNFLGIDLTLPNTVFALFSSALFFLQMKITQVKTKKATTEAKKQKNPEMMVMMQKQMNFIFPVLSFFILLKVGSAVALYLIVSSALSIIETKFLKKKK